VFEGTDESPVSNAVAFDTPSFSKRVDDREAIDSKRL
jgi:hypothetical protein